MHSVLANRLRTAETPSLAAHESSVSPKTVGEVPLTGLSFAGEAEAEDAALEIAAEFVLDVARHGPLGSLFIVCRTDPQSPRFSRNDSAGHQ